MFGGTSVRQSLMCKVSAVRIAAHATTRQLLRHVLYDFVMPHIVDARAPMRPELFAPIYIALLFSGRFRRGASSLSSLPRGHTQRRGRLDNRAVQRYLRFDRLASRSQ